jgi:hypothetical protein
MTRSGEVEMHRYRIAFLSGVAAGFVIGARAGRERYEQMKKLARTAADNPAVQQAAGALQAQAAGLANNARQKVTDQVRDRVPGMAKSAQRVTETRWPGRARRESNGSVEVPGDDSFTQQTGDSDRKRDVGPN